ncbi:MAG TPA: SagB/ThcOx family dehydrogenase [Campylobacterales bacterium]|nr:SagB/ThcOx family dehydrogenase [Campylobacterales bacterium]
MPLFHQQTKHSFMSIRKNSFFLDWRTQPTTYKTYPHFQQRFKIENYEELEGLNLISGITFEKEYPEGKYYLRTVPSAGALFPCEVYVQIRGIKGIISGVYHYESKRGILTLLHEIESDGVESYFPSKTKQKGFLFLISAIYFRSSWKYRNRSIRYIFLDAGHQLGTIYTALCVMGQESNFIFDFDKLSLNETFGFREDEMFLASVSSSQTTQRETAKLKQSFPYVSGCDYLETNRFIEEAYKQSANYNDKPFTPPNFFQNIPKDQLKQAIINRRSIRAFRGEMTSKESYEFIVQGLFEFAQMHNIDIFSTLHRVTDMPEGLYKNGTLVTEGNFQEKSRYLSLEQNLGGMSAVTFYFSSNEVEKYQKVSILSGFIAHIIYIRCELQSVGCSGIGAYYDDEAKAFLNTANNILYLLAVGH